LVGDPEADRPGRLPTAVHDNPYSVLLLDEFEKATSDIHDFFLRVFDEGVFHDAFGNRVTICTMIVIATSNAGSDRIQKVVRNGDNPAEHKDEFVDWLINEGAFRAELLNRFDDIVLFHPLSREHLEEVAQLELTDLADRLEEKGYTLEITQPLIEYVAEEGYDERFGARAMQRVIQNDIEELISQMIIDRAIQQGDTITITKEDLARITTDSSDDSV
jgi:ATP-dependent Clp protease ATP-binding subunit ClpA